jgi:hypothetical protein
MCDVSTAHDQQMYMTFGFGFGAVGCRPLVNWVSDNLNPTCCCPSDAQCYGGRDVVGIHVVNVRR